MHGKRPTITSLHGLVAAAHPLAAQAGAKLLSSGGNAFDAAAATAAALNVVEPFMSGLAGLGYATCYIAAEQRVRVLDFVPPVPARLPVERFRRREDLQRGALSVGTPGSLAGWAELVRAYGKKPLGAALAPAIALARDGFALAEFGVAEFNEQIPLLRRWTALYEDWANTYTGGVASVALGRIVRQPELATTLEAIAAEGWRHLYGGNLGEAIVAHLQRLGGCLTLDDVKAVRPVWKEPLAARYRDLSINTLPPPSEAFQFLLTLRILDGFDFSSLERNGIEHLDTLWRAIRLAAGERIANNNPAPDRLAQILSEQNADRLRARVKDGTALIGPTEQWLPATAPGEHHTTSFSIGDREGNLVCITQSLGSPFGSGVVVPGTGLCLNNFLYWTDVNPLSPNRTRPGDPLPVCMAPSVSLHNGKPVLALGTPGSYGILQTQAQAMVQYLDYGLALQDAIEAPRARLWDGCLVEPEARLEASVLAALAKRGHKIETGGAWTMRVGGMQAIAIDPATGLMTGACDPRRDGYVAAA
ncbi:MAG TPA: gamma-glutamyltransferase [Hyphomicrobiaceae bacterium]|nr:gamma-glutamyltransferase [Hyphomicrobiaceae bacterium]